jgi:hypothetical protein
MDYSDQDTKPRNEIDILLALARRLENEGDAQGAINSYQLALAHLSRRGSPGPRGPYPSKYQRQEPQCHSLQYTGRAWR